jgi:hypothetical protein
LPKKPDLLKLPCLTAQNRSDHVKSSRGNRLRSDDAHLFSGEFWTAKGWSWQL